KKLKIKDTALPAEELFGLLHFIDTIKRLKRMLEKKDFRDYRQIVVFEKSLRLCDSLRSALQRTFDKDGKIKDTASKELQSLRSRIRSLETQIRSDMHKMVSSKNLSSYLQDDYFTVRNSRYVIPVKREFQSRVNGIIHGESDSGKTVFVEPQENIPSDNELSKLLLKEKDEIRKILFALSAKVREDRYDLQADYNSLIRYDIIRAIALWSTKNKCNFAKSGKSHNLKNARHPLLLRSAQNNGTENEIVPLNLKLSPDTFVLAITGANAGGKTVAIKTTGLLTLLAMCGLPIPADEETEILFCNEILADIGDEQSIENNLSTFSGHLKRISEYIKITQETKGDVMVLLDELGSGTDPVEGGALACAILEEFADSATLVLATTHLGTVKSYVHNCEHMMNASMKFNSMTHKSEFELETGYPGRSHAMTLADSMGMPEKVMKNAREMLDSDYLHLETLLKKLENDQQSIAQMEKDLSKDTRLVQNEKDAIREEQKDLNRNRKKIINEAYNEASNIVERTRKDMNRLLKSIEQEKNSTVEKNAREKIIKQKTEIIQKQYKNKPKPKKIISPKNLQISSKVWIEKLKSNVKIIELSHNQGKAKVRSGGLDFTVLISDLEVPRGIELPKEKPLKTARPRVAGQIKHELNLVGERIAPAKVKLEQFLDRSLLASLDEVTIIHGYGTGQLQQAVHETLKEYRAIKRFRFGDSGKNEGGAGVTIVTLGG
ncbi:MAG: Smr/MutS family protein, partial [Verrucomicrobiota bacterium]|nr:Smr/MutS family protein [Verrucomicrobiota bacterium]